MGPEKVMPLSKKDEEIAEILNEIGYKKNYARVLVFLFREFEMTSREIERGTDLRQPEVSIAINYLIKKQWVQVVDLITENKGRPVKIYHLACSVDTILDEIKDEKMGDYVKQIDSIERVRELIKESRATEKPQ